MDLNGEERGERDAEHRYLIVGGGLTGDAACKGIRDVDPDGAIVLVSRGAASALRAAAALEGALEGDDESTIWRGTAELGVDLQLGRRIVALDLERREARDDRARPTRYEKLLLATGGRPRRLPFGGDDVIYFRTLDDYRRLRALAERGAAHRRDRRRLHRLRDRRRARAHGCAVTMVFPEPANRRPHLPGRAFGGAQRLLPRARRRGARPASR